MQQSAFRPRAAFRYRDYGNLATIGRRAAVVEIRGYQLSGTLAWCFWLAAHIFFLIGFRNRLVVLMDWAWAYLTYDRNARIISNTHSALTSATPPAQSVALWHSKQ